MHKIAIVLLSLMLVVAPVSAQSIPTIQPGVVTEVSDAAQTLGLINIIQLIIVVSTVVVGIIGAAKIVPPLIQAVTSAQQQLVAMQVQMASVMERMMAQTGKMESGEQAAAARKETAKEINDHTDAAVKTIDGKLQQVATTLEELKKTVVTKKTLDDAINPLVEKIDAALKVIHDLQQPDPAPDTPANSAVPDGASIGEVDAKGEKE